MCDSRQPSNGADSGRLPSYAVEPSWQPTKWMVTCVDDDGDRFPITVPAAIGKKDAYSQAVHEARLRGRQGVSAVAAEEVVAA